MCKAQGPPLAGAVRGVGSLERLPKGQAPLALIQCHLGMCCSDCQLLIQKPCSLVAPSLGTKGARFPLMEEFLNKNLDTASAKAVPWTPVVFCPSQGFTSLDAQCDGREEGENNARCCGASSFWLVASTDKHPNTPSAQWGCSCRGASHHVRRAGCLLAQHLGALVRN